MKKISYFLSGKTIIAISILILVFTVGANYVFAVSYNAKLKPIGEIGNKIESKNKCTDVNGNIINDCIEKSTNCSITTNTSTLCSISYPPNTEVTFTAIPEGSSQFSGWEGACTGIEKTCTLKMDSDKNITAKFSKSEGTNIKNEEDLNTNPPKNTQEKYENKQIESIISINSIPDLIKQVLEGIIKIFLPVIALAIIYCGFLFVSAQGNPEKIETAKTALIYTLIGAAIILGSWGLSQLITSTVRAL